MGSEMSGSLTGLTDEWFGFLCLPRFACARAGRQSARGGGIPPGAQSWNQYAYSRNDPIDLTDPSGQHWWNWLITGVAFGADIFLAGGVGSALAAIAESVAISYRSDLIQGQYRFHLEQELEGAALSDLGSKYLDPHLPKAFLAKAPIRFGERAFESFVSNEPLKEQARVDWIGTAIGTGLDILNDYANGRPCLVRKANAESGHTLHR